MASPLPDLWDVIKTRPEVAAIYFTLFFAAAAAVSLAAHALLSYETEVRRLSWLALLLTVYIAVYIGVAGRGVVIITTPAPMTIHELMIILMFLGVCAECAQGGPQWVIAHFILQLLVVIPLIYTQPGVGLARGADIVNALFPVTPFTASYQLPVFSVYFTLSGIIRMGALYDCQRQTSFSERERWWFRCLLIFQLRLDVSCAPRLRVTPPLPPSSAQPPRLVLLLRSPRYLHRHSICAIGHALPSHGHPHRLQHHAAAVGAFPGAVACSRPRLRARGRADAP